MKLDKFAVLAVVMIVAAASGIHAGVALAGPGNAPDNAGDRDSGDDRGPGGPPDAAEQDDDDRRDRDADDDPRDRGNRGDAPGSRDRTDRGSGNVADASDDDDDRGPDRNGPPFGNDGPPFGDADGPPFGNDGPPFGNDGPPFGNDGDTGFGNAEGPPTDMPENVPDHVAKIHRTIRDFLSGVLDGIRGNAVSDIASGNNPSNDAADGS